MHLWICIVFQRLLGHEDIVEPFTAGIIPHQVDSSSGNMVIYDLAGHHQYFSSHSACLEAISPNSPAIFLLLQDLRKDSESIKKELYYWSTMMNGVCHKCDQKSQVIVVGTHADLLTPQDVTRKLAYLQSVAKSVITDQTLITAVALNAKDFYSSDMEQFKILLQEANKIVVSCGPSVPFLSHLLIAFLKDKIPSDVDVVSLSDLYEVILTDPDKSIRPDMFKIIPLLQTLSEKGLIFFIPSEDPSFSWIVLNQESILKKINGTLFADPTLNEYTHLASNTGIVSEATLKRAFPEHDIQMITHFMIQFELCHKVDISQFNTNMAPEEDSDLGTLFFFPALVRVDRPSSTTVPSNSFGWSIIVKSPNQFFTPRYLHVLVRRLTDKFVLPAVHATPLHNVRNRRCDVWSRGIKWVSDTGVTAIIEMNEALQSLSLITHFHTRTDRNYLELAHSVRAFVKNTCQEFCPRLEVLDVISCPPEATSDSSDDTKVELWELFSALDNGKMDIHDMKGQKHVAMEKWIALEPCLKYLVGGQSCANMYV